MSLCISQMTWWITCAPPCEVLVPEMFWWHCWERHGVLSSSQSWSWATFQSWCCPGDSKAILQCSLVLATRAFWLFSLCKEREIELRNLPVLCFTFLIIWNSQIASAECSFLGVMAQILPLRWQFFWRLMWKTCNSSCSYLSFAGCICRNPKLPYNISFLKLHLGISDKLIPGTEAYKKLLIMERCKIKWYWKLDHSAFLWGPQKIILKIRTGECLFHSSLLNISRNKK